MRVPLPALPDALPTSRAWPAATSMPVEEARIGELAGTDIGLVADGEIRRRRVFRHHDGNHRQIVFAGEIEIALVVCGAAEDGAGAVRHENEIGDIDGQLPRGIEGMRRRQARCRSPASRPSRSLLPPCRCAGIRRRIRRASCLSRPILRSADDRATAPRRTRRTACRAASRTPPTGCGRSTDRTRSEVLPNGRSSSSASAGLFPASAPSCRARRAAHRYRR